MRDYQADYEALRAAVEALAEEWERQQAKDEDFLDRFGPDTSVGPSAIYHRRHAEALRRALAAQPEGCACPPCPGRGHDGHAMSHCAECCFGSGVEADPDCPQHGLPAAQPEALTEGPCERTTVEVCGFHGLDWPCAAQPEAREELVCICGHPGLTFDGFDPECPTHGRDAPTAQAAAGEVRPVEDVTDLDEPEARRPGPGYGDPPAAHPEAFGDLSDPESDRDHRDDHDAWLRAQPEAREEQDDLRLCDCTPHRAPHQPHGFRFARPDAPTTEERRHG